MRGGPLGRYRGGRRGLKMWLPDGGGVGIPPDGWGRLAGYPADARAHPSSGWALVHPRRPRRLDRFPTRWGQSVPVLRIVELSDLAWHDLFRSGQQHRLSPAAGTRRDGWW